MAQKSHRHARIAVNLARKGAQQACSRPQHAGFPTAIVPVQGQNLACAQGERHILHQHAHAPRERHMVKGKGKAHAPCVGEGWLKLQGGEGGREREEENGRRTGLEIEGGIRSTAPTRVLRRQLRIDTSSSYVSHRGRFLASDTELGMK